MKPETAIQELASIINQHSENIINTVKQAQKVEPEVVIAPATVEINKKINMVIDFDDQSVIVKKKDGTHWIVEGSFRVDKIDGTWLSIHYLESRIVKVTHNEIKYEIRLAEVAILKYKNINKQLNERNYELLKIIILAKPSGVKKDSAILHNKLQEAISNKLSAVAKTIKLLFDNELD